MSYVPLAKGTPNSCARGDASIQLSRWGHLSFYLRYKLRCNPIRHIFVLFAMFLSRAILWSGRWPVRPIFALIRNVSVSGPCSDSFLPFFGTFLFIDQPPPASELFGRFFLLIRHISVFRPTASGQWAVRTVFWPTSARFCFLTNRVRSVICSEHYKM